MFRSGWSEAVVRDAEGSADCSTSEVSNSVSGSFSFFSRGVKSKPVPVPGVFGVFAEPKDAKAPLPRPKADDAPTEGDLATDGDKALKGFVLPWEEVSPKRLEG